MNLSDIKDKVLNGLAVIFLIFAIIIAINGAIHTCSSNKQQSPSPVEGMKVIDSLIIANDKIILEVETLDSIKDAKVIEVKSLDNDSTLKLFYKLIRE